MKLGFVSDFYYPSIGGTQMLCQNIAEWFQNQGNEIEIITSIDPIRKGMNYKVYEIARWDFEENPLFLEENYDAIFVFADLFSPSILSLQTEQVKKSILILNLDENVYRWIHEGRIQDLQERIAAVKKYSSVISFCQGAPINKFLEENDINYHFIPNFSRDILNSEKSDKITKEALGITKKIIFNHGLIESRKNQLELMRAFLNSKLVEEYQLVLLGSPRGNIDNQYFKECKKLADSSHSITMIKGTNNQVIINSLLRMSDIYVLPSTAEGLPLVLIEAMSAGLPWVSTPVGGVPAVFGGLKGGKVLSSFDLSELETSIREIENKNSRSDWEYNFTVGKAGKQYEELLRK
jgi:glycosyltransferase involved in cell wall biosynthesis